MELVQKQIKSFPSGSRHSLKSPVLQKSVPGSSLLLSLRRRRLKHWMRETDSLFKNLLFSEPVLGIRGCMSAGALSAFEENIKSFLRQARLFAPDMNPEDMGQALRNFMVYAIFREQNGLPQNCPSSIFGYSMLYPYTDNFLDDPERTEEEKKHYNLFIHGKIAGHPIPPLSVHEEKTAMLLDAVAAVYPDAGPDRMDAPGADIRQGLLLMLEAQEISLKQSVSSDLTERQILDISIYKGGLSVLIDRYFIDLEMTEEDIVFYFGFGFLLQLCDDLQDIGQDKESGSKTLLSSCASPAQAAFAVNRLFTYTAELFRFCPGKSAAFRNFLLQNCYELILSSAVGSSPWFETAYIKSLESYLPVSLGYMEEMKAKMPAAFPSAGRENMMEMLDAFLC